MKLAFLFVVFTFVNYTVIPLFDELQRVSSFSSVALQNIVAHAYRFSGIGILFIHVDFGQNSLHRG
jgi:hypothetical protein